VCPSCLFRSRFAYPKIALWGQMSESTPNTLNTMDQVFLDGLKAGKDRNFLGHRPLISTNPPKYANHYAWQTYGQVDERRRNLGSALSALFRSGDLEAGDFKTVGIWSQNRAGM
jgi:long-chain acyl-CoA synthetase